jgi:phage-related protein
VPEVVNYSDPRGVEPVDEYVLRLRRTGEQKAYATLARLVGLLREQGTSLGMPWARLIDRRDRIYELRPGSHRVAFAEHAGAIVLLHAWRKQTRTLDSRELAVARNRLHDWRSRAAR